VIYPNNFEEKIGFSRIRELVAKNCLFLPGIEEIEKLHLLQDKKAIEEELDRVEEFRQIQQSDKEFPIHHFHDSRSALKKATVEGTYLELEEVKGLAKSLESVRLIKRFFDQQEEEAFPELKKLASIVKFYPFVSDRINKILNKQGQIKDNASSELANIRSSLSSKQNSVSRMVNRLLKKAQQEGWVEEDATATIRDGRPVIPVTASHKRALGGLIHDESTSGKTAYVEPAEVVQLTNEIRELEYAERREIIQILVSFTDDIRPYIPELESMHDFLAKIDSIRARALFAIRIQAVRPDLLSEPGFEWIKAVHPLLYLSLQKDNREVIPLSLKLLEEDRLLLISGPNAGGKSVCLQTVGLLQYMLQCGLLVPVSEGSRFGIFSGIFIDIGDEQSIDNDLSTYSSHLVNMKFFLKHTSAKTLILIDEFGTGTEPQLGAAIAESMLEQLNANETFGVITTHYSNLKHLASSTDGIVNGAMLFDNQKMAPLYELEVGKPGSSFAFEIARKIGLPEEVLQNASDKVGKDHIDFDKHLKDIIRDKKYWERKRQKVRQSEKKLEELMLKYEQELGDSEKKRKTLIAEAKREAEQILAQTNKRIENTIREIKESNADKERTREARKNLESFREQVNTEDSMDAKHAAQLKKLRDKEKALSHHRPDLKKKSRQAGQQAKVQEIKKEIVVGSLVKLEGQEATGEVLEIQGKKCVVAFGQIKSTVAMSRLSYVSGKVKTESRQKAAVNLGEWNVSKRKVNFKSDLDIRGKRAEEALKAVSDLIDEAVMVGASEIRVLHGKGDGILRHLIREFLATSDVVDSYGDEHIERGGSGITIVRFDY